MRTLALSLSLLFSLPALSQMPGMEMKKSSPSTELTVTGITGKTKTVTPAELKEMAHVTVHVHNMHTQKDETYGGVPVKDLLAMVAPAKEEAPKVSSNMIIIVAGATDSFHVAITLCDTNPECRNGQAIVADTLDGTPITADGAFKLVLTEDKKPGRWARNLSSLAVKAVN